MKKIAAVSIALLVFGVLNVSAATLAVNNAAAMGGTGGTACSGGPCGLEVTFNGATSAAFVRDDTPANEGIYRAQFWFDPNNITMNDGTFHVLFRATQEVPFRACFQIMLVKKSGLTRLWVRGLNNPGTERFTNRINIPADGPQLIQVEWERSDTPGVLNGYATISIIDGSAAGATETVMLNNSAFGVDFVNMGAVGNIAATTIGSHYFDEFESYRTLAP